MGKVQKVCQFKRHTSLSELHTIIFVRFQSIILAFVWAKPLKPRSW